MVQRIRDDAGASTGRRDAAQPGSRSNLRAGRDRVVAVASLALAAHRRHVSVEWKIALGGRTITLRPLLDDQENDARASTGTLYWEGAVRAFDERGRAIGRGYLELTGYGERLRL